VIPLKEIESAKEVARRAAAYETRRTLARYYTIWATYPLVLFLVYALPAPYAFLSVLILYAALNFYIFRKLFLRLKRLGDVGIHRTFMIQGRLIGIVGSAAVGVLFWIGYGLSISPALLIAYALYAGVVDFLLLRILSLTGVKYYDLIAMVSFSGAMLSYALPNPPYVLAGVIVSLAWIFAGLSSFEEVIEGSWS
jgi:hypothetical protein